MTTKNFFTGACTYYQGAKVMDRNFELCLDLDLHLSHMDFKVD
jgi:hypothetical protein